MSDATVAQRFADSCAYFEADVGPIRPEVAAALPCFAWDLEKLRRYPAPVQAVAVVHLTHFLDAPVWRRAGDRPFTLSPAEAAVDPDAHREHLDQTMRTDLTYQVDLMVCERQWRLAEDEPLEAGLAPRYGDAMEN